MVKLRWLKKYKEIKKGEIAEASKKSAENFVKQGYAEYVEESKKLISKDAKDFRNKNPEIKEAVKKMRKQRKMDIPLKKEELMNKDHEKLIKEDLKKKEWKRKKDEEEIENYNEGINFIGGEYYNSWKRIKRKNAHQLKQFLKDDLFFLGHSNDEIVGKPILYQQTRQTIPLVIEVEKKDKDGGINTSFKFIDDRFDKRYDGYEVDSLDIPFWTYRIIYKGDEYIVFSDKELGSEEYLFKGMKIRMPHLSEMSKSLKMRAISNIFICKESEPKIKKMPKEEIIPYINKFIEQHNIKQEHIPKFKDFMKDILFLHPDGYIYNQPEDYRLFRHAQIFSAKEHNYPLSALIMGSLALSKTTECECINNIFQEYPGILEAGNSTPKSLVPSFKEKPASPGYILSCNRVALIDELMKMINNAMNNTRSLNAVLNQLGQLNMLLEHKNRTVGSGNDNFFKGEATAKCIFYSNPLPNKNRVCDHVGILDKSTLSRILIYVKDDKYAEFISNNIPKKCANMYTTLLTSFSIEGVGGYSVREVFAQYIRPFYVSIYDSCQDFVVNHDSERVRKIFQTLLPLCTNDMKEVWKGRGLHHTLLLLDGITKFRVLFEDFDNESKNKFEALNEDYENLEKMIVRIINSWSYDMNKREDYSSF